MCDRPPTWWPSRLAGRVLDRVPQRAYAPGMTKLGVFVSLALVLFTALPAEIQGATNIPRIGLLDYARFWDPLIQRLSELGYVEGRTIVFEYRASEGRPERLPALAQ